MFNAKWFLGIVLFGVLRLLSWLGLTGTIVRSGADNAGVTEVAINLPVTSASSPFGVGVLATDVEEEEVKLPPLPRGPRRFPPNIQQTRRHSLAGSRRPRI